MGGGCDSDGTGSAAARACVAVARWVPVVFVVAVLAWAYYAYVYQLTLLTVEPAALQVLYLVVFHILLFLFVSSYYQTIFTPLRRPPDEFYLTRECQEELSAVSEDSDHCEVLARFVTLQSLPIRTKAFEGGIRYCLKCKCIKPDRSHHCSICSQCVLKFDHHCPWVNTCVSFHNYKYFLLFLGYGFTLCLWGAITDLPYFIHFWQHDIGQGGRVLMGQFHVVFLFFVSAMFCASLGCLFFYHLYLTARNRTTLESFRPPLFSHGPDKKAYDVGVSSNYRQVFGTRPLYWPLPLYSTLGDGLRFPNRDTVTRRGAESASLLRVEEEEDEEDEVFVRLHV